MLIHASGSTCSVEALESPAIQRALATARIADVRDLPRGAIVGIVNVASFLDGDDTKQMEKVPHAQRLLCGADGNVDGVFLWKLTHPAFVPPVPCRGRLGLWPVHITHLRKLNGHF